MRLISYNIHFGFGQDDRCDLTRISDTVRDADVIFVALKAYSLGNKAEDAKGPADAVPFHQRAVELDP